MKRLLRVVLPLLVLVAGIGAYSYLMATKPEPPKSPPAPHGTVVVTEPAIRLSEKPTISAVGRAHPSRISALQPEVGGRIVEANPSLELGGFVKAGELAFKIDDTDYKLIEKQAAAQVSQARFEMQVEAGRQNVAKKEWALLESEIVTSDAGKQLALRKPHLRLAQANVHAARSVLERAKLNVTKTTVTIPFNAYVTSEMLEVGLLAQPGAQLAQIVGTDTFWVEAALPIERLSSIRIPGVRGVPEDGGAHVEVRLAEGGEDGVFQGQVLRLLNELDTLGVQARLLITVDDPLRLKPGNTGTRLFRGAFVNLAIEAEALDDVIRIPRTALREDDKVWVKVGQKLEMRDVDIVWRERDHVLVRRGVQPGELLITNRLSKATNGMPVRHQDETPPKQATGETASGPATAAADATKTQGVTGSEDK